MNESERVREEMEIELLPVTTDTDFLHYHRRIMEISYIIFCANSHKARRAFIFVVVNQNGLHSTTTRGLYKEVFEIGMMLRKMSS